MWIIRVHGDAFGGLASIPQWLESFDVDAHDGRGFVNLTTARDRAMRFDDAGAALGAWRTRSTVRPTRPDGQPNRPLTMYTVEVEPL